MAKFNTKKKEVNKEEPQIQYVPYERYISNVLLALVNKMDKITRDIDVIKERITFDAKEKEGK